MPLSTLGTNTISKATNVTRKVLDEVLPVLQGLNAIYDPPTTGQKAVIVQADLDAAPNLSGLTKAQLDSALNVLTFTIMPAIVNNYPALMQLAARA